MTEQKVIRIDIELFKDCVDELIKSNPTLDHLKETQLLRQVLIDYIAMKRSKVVLDEKRKRFLFKL